MDNKVVFVLLDGLNLSSTKEHLGYLEHLCKANIAAKYEVLGELPSASRPMYETIFTGLLPYQHRITNNAICRLSNQNHLFKKIKQANKKSLVCGYYWISELYLSAPFDYHHDIYHDDKSSNIDRGFFYFEDHFPDSHLYGLANQFMDQDDYDFVLIHPMNIDDAGHKYGCLSKQYSQAIMQNDKLLSTYLPMWLDDNYSVVVASDHGMSEGGYHGGNSEKQRLTGLYVIDNRVQPGYFTHRLTTLQIAPLLCYLLQIEPEKQMQPLEVKLKHEENR